jgi:hypothetical protein
MQRIYFLLLFFSLSAYSYAEEKPKMESDTIRTHHVNNLSKLSKAIKAQEFHLKQIEMDKKLEIPVIQQGFFCKFEDLLQIKYKIPVNFGVE